MSDIPQFGAIYCDPAWKFEYYSEKGVNERAAESHYRTEHIDEIARIPVPRWSARDCAIFMWTVDSHVDQAIELMRAWDFAFKTVAFIWVKTCKSDPEKPRMSLGRWTRKEAEICLMGTKGKPRRLSAGVRQVIMEPRREHSRKPDCVRDRIRELVAGPYLELNARQRFPHWWAWGNEVDKFGVLNT